MFFSYANFQRSQKRHCIHSSIEGMLYSTFFAGECHILRGKKLTWRQNLLSLSYEKNAQESLKDKVVCYF